MLNEVVSMKMFEDANVPWKYWSLNFILYITIKSAINTYYDRIQTQDIFVSTYYSIQFTVQKYFIWERKKQNIELIDRIEMEEIAVFFHFFFLSIILFPSP